MLEQEEFHVPPTHESLEITYKLGPRWYLEARLLLLSCKPKRRSVCSQITFCVFSLSDRTDRQEEGFS